MSEQWDQGYENVSYESLDVLEKSVTIYELIYGLQFSTARQCLNSEIKVAKADQQDSTKVVKVDPPGA